MASSVLSQLLGGCKVWMLIRAWARTDASLSLLSSNLTTVSGSKISNRLSLSLLLFSRAFPLCFTENGSAARPCVTHETLLL